MTPTGPCRRLLGALWLATNTKSFMSDPDLNSAEKPCRAMITGLQPASTGTVLQNQLSGLDIWAAGGL